MTDSQDHPRNSNLNIPLGFRWSSSTAGLKPSGRPDLAVCLCESTASAAAVFTQNLFAAAPVVLGREHLLRSRGRVSAVIVNAGNANCATGAEGLKAAKAVCAQAAASLKVPSRQIFPSSTGVIGVPLPYAQILQALPTAIQCADSSATAVQGFSGAIMTTDTRPKVESASFAVGKKTVRVLGIAKGSGMIHPNMATMLCYIFTDIAAAPGGLRRELRAAVEQTFNRISVDGDTSTNDTVLLLASGASGVDLDSRSARLFSHALQEVCRSLAEAVIFDGEGVKHVVDLIVEGTRSDAEATQIARTIATSPLVKTAWAGCDPNWGRLLAAAGRSGVKFDPTGVSVFIGDHQVCASGMAKAFDRSAARTTMQRPRFTVRIRVGRGKGRCHYLASDLTAEYVAINSEYTT